MTSIRVRAARPASGLVRLAHAALVLASIPLTAACGESGPDVATPPIVVSTSPGLGERDVSVVPSIEIVWDQPMDPSRGLVTLDPGGDLPAALGVWADDGRTVTVAVEETLPPETPVSVVVDDFASAEGLTPDAAHRFTFRTGPDLDPPDLRSSRPREGQVDIDPDAFEELVLTFDEDMDVTVTNAPISFDGGTPRSVAGRWDETARVFAVEGAVLDLPFNADVTFDVSGFLDLAGNPLGEEGAGGDGLLSFETGPNRRPPFIQNATPREGATRVAVDIEEINVVFSESMDESVTEFELVPDLDGLDPIPLTGGYEEDGLVLVLPVPEPLVRGAGYALDLRGARDLLGTPIPDDEAFTEDGVLDFRVTPPTGEDCDTLLSVRDGETVDGRTTFVIPASDDPDSDVKLADGGAASCSPLGAGVDAVLVYEKTTAAYSDGGTVLRVTAEAPAGVANLIGLEIVAGACAPAAERFAETQLACETGRSRWDRHLDVGPGTYHLFVVGPEGGEGFPGATVTVEELDDLEDIEGDSCLLPYTEESDNHTEVGGAHIWTLASDSVHGFDLDRSWGGDGALSCTDDFSYGDRHGVDAVIEFDKAEADTALEVTVSGPFGLDFEIFTGGCQPGTPGRQSRFCDGAFAFGQRTAVGVGYAGPVHIWLAPDRPATTVPAATVTVRETTVAQAGDACGNGLPLVSGENPVDGVATSALGRPSCFALDSQILWYEYELAEAGVQIASDGSITDSIAVIDAASGVELACGVPTAAPTTVLRQAGDTICVGIRGAATTSNLTITDVAYDGIRGREVSSVFIDLPPSSVPGFPPRISEQWLAISDDRAFVSDFSGFVHEVDLETGSDTVHDSMEGLGAQVSRLGGVSLDGELYTLGSTIAGARFYQAWDGMAPSWTPTPWDGDAGAFGTSFLSALTFDGDSFLISSGGSSASLFMVPRDGGDPTELSASPSVLGRVDLLAADDEHLYLMDSFGDTISRVRRDEVGRVDAIRRPLPLGAVLSVVRSMATDGDVDTPARYLYFSSLTPAGVHVIENPGSPDARYLGRLFETGFSDIGLHYDHETDRLWVFDSKLGGSARPRIVQLE